jgi:hypothetical protein
VDNLWIGVAHRSLLTRIRGVSAARLSPDKDDLESTLSPCRVGRCGRRDGVKYREHGCLKWKARLSLCLLAEVWMPIW